jgi:heme oxygenase
VSAALSVLRAGTAEEHDRLERGLDVVGLARTPEGYRRLLETFWGFYVELEPRLESGLAEWNVLPGWSRWEVLGWLADDLHDLGCDAECLRGLPRCTDLPALDDPDSVWACLYVVEGAALGGAVLAAQLAGVPGAPSRFFHGYGEDRGRRWHRFRRSLADWLAGEGSLPAVTASARATFRSFEQWCVPRLPASGVRQRAG